MCEQVWNGLECRLKDSDDERGAVKTKDDNKTHERTFGPTLGQDVPGTTLGSGTMSREGIGHDGIISAVSPPFWHLTIRGTSMSFISVQFSSHP